MRDRRPAWGAIECARVATAVGGRRPAAHRELPSAHGGHEIEARAAHHRGALAHNPSHHAPQSPLIRARTRYVEFGPSHPHVGLLFRAWATPPTCGIGGPRVGWPVDVRNRQTTCRRRWPYTRLAASRANPLCGAWAFSSARGPAIPSLGNPAHVRNRRPTCGTGGPRAGCEGARVVVACGQSVTDRGAAAHARDAVCA